MYYHITNNKFGWFLLDVMPGPLSFATDIFIPVEKDFEQDIDVERMLWFCFPEFLPGYWTKQQVVEFVRHWENGRHHFYNMKEEQRLKELTALVGREDWMFDNRHNSLGLDDSYLDDFPMEQY